MNTQEEKNVNVPENAKPAKRVLTADALCHQAGMAIQTGIKAGEMGDWMQEELEQWEQELKWADEVK